MTEKSGDAECGWQVYVFMVRIDATKPEIKKAIQELYKVDVVAVNIVNRPAKTQAFRPRLKGTPGRIPEGDRHS